MSSIRIDSEPVTMDSNKNKILVNSFDAAVSQSEFST
jgi:hypothetical protein